MTHIISIKNPIVGTASVEYKIDQKEKQMINLIKNVNTERIEIESNSVYNSGMEFILCYIRNSIDTKRDEIPPKPLPHSYQQENIFGRDVFILNEFMTRPNPWFEKKRDETNSDHFETVLEVHRHIANLIEMINTTDYFKMDVLCSKLCAVMALVVRKLPYDTDLIKYFKNVYPRLI